MKRIVNQMNFGAGFFNFLQLDDFDLMKSRSLFRSLFLPYPTLSISHHTTTSLPTYSTFNFSPLSHPSLFFKLYLL